ncbi:MAG: ankyrin repeat domain-containing protein [Thermoanaerobaculia bacterium]
MSTQDNLRKAAKRWLKALRHGDAGARARLARAYPGAPEHPTLRDVQHALARERGHPSWIALTRAIAGGSPPEAGETPLSALLAAAGGGDVAAVATILDDHPGIVNERGTLSGSTGLRTALHFGVRHEAVVRTLLDRGADPNVRDEGDHAFPLHFAAERGDLPVVRLLIEHGADPIGADTKHELDALGWAVCFDYAYHPEVVRYLLAHGAVHTLFSAVAMGDTAGVRRLAASGVALDRRMDRTNHRRTVLHLAIAKKQAAALATLIDLGAGLDLEDAVGLTPLDQAALAGEDEMTRLLLAAGADLTLPAAVVLGRSDQVERLIQANPEILSGTNNRRWARLLVYASGHASAGVIETLLGTVMRHRAGLSIVNMEDDAETAVDGVSGYTPLHAAAFHGNDDAVDVLLKHGANPRARDGKYCGTPAGWAAYAGHLATAQRILEADVDIFDAIAFDRADRIAAILDGDPGAMDRPFKAYASCGSRDGQGWPRPDDTPLPWATEQGKQEAVRILTERGAGARTADDRRRADRVVSFLQAACWGNDVHGKRAHRMHGRAAQRLLAHDPWIARDGLYTAVVCGECDEVARILAARPEAARQRGGARGWTPILYLAYTRFTHASTIENALSIARLLLDHGADPNDFLMAGDARYTVLVGVAGEGEQDAPRQPYAAALFQLLLERGAEPFDIQVLYNTHFSGDVLWWLELVYEHTIDTPRGAAWRDPEWGMFDMGAYGSGARFLLEIAIKRRDAGLAAWLLARGANPNAAPARDRRFPKGSLYQLAVLEDLPEIAELLARHGAPHAAPVPGEPERFLHACLRLDGDEARWLLRAHPDYLRSPAAMFEAARRDRPDVLALLLDLGFALEIGDHTGKRALHEAAWANALRAAAFLIERGAQIDPRESTYGGTPMSWASHGDHAAILELLAPLSRDVWALCANGYVDRLHELLAEDPRLALAVTADGRTPLWWLPDDEAAALQAVELLVATGADPAAKSADGRTAADAARDRGMRKVTARLDLGFLPPAAAEQP